MGKPKSERRLSDDEARAVSGFIRTSPRKLNLVAGSIRGKAADAALAAQWEARMGRRDLERLEARIGPMLEARGYDLSGLPPRAPSAPERAWLALHSRLGALRFRMRRYGPGLWLRELATRRLGLRAAHERALREQQDIDERFIK